MLDLNNIESWEYVECEQVYDIEVEDNHNYYLADKILVHNSSKTYSIMQLFTLYAIKNTKKELISIVSESVPHLNMLVDRRILKEHTKIS